MKNVFIGCGAALLLFLFIIGVIGFVVYDSYKNFPEYAQKDVVYEEYHSLINQLEETIEKSDTMLNLASNLEKLAFPENILYMALEKTSHDDGFSMDNKDLIEIIKRYDGNTKSTTIINGTGFGTAGNKQVIIIEYAINKFDDLDNCTIYLERNKSK